MANVSQSGGSGSSSINNYAAQMAKEAADRAAALLAAKKQAEQRNALASAPVKQTQTNAIVDTKKAATPTVTKAPVTKTVAPVVKPPTTPKKDEPKKDEPQKDPPKVDEPIVPVDNGIVETEAYAPQTPSFDTTAYINSLAEARTAQAIAELGKARDNQLSNLSGEEAGIKPMYYNQRNSTAATNLTARRTLAEELAARGETRSGVADQANINYNMSLQSGLGDLNNQEASDIADIARRRSGVQNAYESDVANARAGFEAAAMQNLIDQFNADRQFKLSEAGLTGTYNGGQTLAGQNQAFNQNMATRQFDNDVAQQKLDNLYRQQTFDYQKSRDVVSDSQWQQSMNLDLRKQSFNEAQTQIENALANRRISQEDASQALQWARFNADQDPNSLDNQYKKAQIDSLTGKTNTNTTATVDDYASTINSLYVVGGTAANGYKGSIDKAGVKAYLDNLILSGVSDAVVDSLATRFNIQ